MKVKLEIPSFFHFETKLKIRVSDVNYGGHLGNDSVLSLAHESRVQFFKSLNMMERNFFGKSLIMADSVVVYKSQGFLGDEINVKISITELRSHGFKLFYLFKKNDFQIWSKLSHARRRNTTSQRRTGRGPAIEIAGTRTSDVVDPEHQLPARSL